MSYLTMYFVFCAITLVMVLVSTKLDNKSVTVADMLVGVACSVIPLLNIVTFLGFTLELCKQTDLMNRKLF